MTRPTANVIEGNYFYQSRISHNSGQLMEVSFTRCWVCPLITCNSQEAIITILEKGLYQPASWPWYKGKTTQPLAKGIHGLVKVFTNHHNPLLLVIGYYPITCQGMDSLSICAEPIMFLRTPLLRTPRLSLLGQALLRTTWCSSV